MAVRIRITCFQMVNTRRLSQENYWAKFIIERQQ